MCVDHGQQGAKSFSVAANKYSFGIDHGQSDVRMRPNRPKSFSVAANNYAVALAAARFGTTHRAPGKVFLFSSFK